MLRQARPSSRPGDCRWSPACGLLALVLAGFVGSCGGDNPPTLAPTTTLPSPPPTLAATPVVTQPTPVPTPEACPTLLRWTSKIHNITDASNRPSATPVVGGHVIVDSTPLFVGGACNAEHDSCGGRRCEDPRGGDWTLLEGDSLIQEREDGYQLRIGPLKPGRHIWRVCPRSDAEDAEGQRLVLGPEPCTQGEFGVPNE